MKIMHIVAGELTGGAARGAYWLHKALLDLGIESNIWTNSKTTFNDDTVHTILQNKFDKFLNIIRLQIDNNLQALYRNRERLIFSTGLVGVDFTKSKLYKDSDVVHLHWINAGLINIKHLRKVKKPLIWTLRDMWPMTGGCHVPLECKNFISGCGNCKQLHSHKKYDLSRYVLNRKIKYLPKSIRIVAISNWLSEMARQSLLFHDFNISMIHNNIDTNDFFPINKEIARKALNIISSKKIILFGSTSSFDSYKGFSIFVDALRFLDNKKYFLCFFGHVDFKIIDKLGFECKTFGYIYNNILLRLIYSCSDVFVAPSLMDAFGKTLAEAMACGTPVVCFDATGPKDIVDHKLNGYKASAFDPFDLAQGIEWIANNPDYDKLCESAREKAIKEFDNKVIAKKYINLYKELLNSQ